MNLQGVKRMADHQWLVEPDGAMRVPAVLYADETLLREMDDKVRQQLCNVASLPGIVGAAYAMPDAHWGYGFPIGGVAAFDAERDGVVSAGGVGFDISCGVRTLLTNHRREDIVAVQTPLAHELSRAIPAGVGSTGRLRLAEREMDAMLTGGARWAVACGYGDAADLTRIEEQGCIAGLRDMALEAGAFGIRLPDRELACAPIRSDLGQRYVGAMRAAMNCALANRQILMQLCRAAFREVLPGSRLDLLYDVSHNICKEETHLVDGAPRRLHVHRKGATRAFGPGHAAVPQALRPYGQPVLIGGSMGTASYVLAGVASAEALSLGSACHGAGRSMSRHQATRRWKGRDLVNELAGRGILIRSPSLRGVAEEAPGAYKSVERVVEAAEHAGLARRVARLEPLICIKG
jgi:RNA-splicing ligase RtcB